MTKEPANTLSFTFFFTFSLSPVINASSTWLSPFTTIPSTAIFSPALQTKISPTFTSSIVTSFTFSSSTFK